MGKEIDLKPVSMFTITARLINHIIQAVTDSFGEKGHDLIKVGIKAFTDEQISMIKKVNNKYDIKKEALFNYEKLTDETKVEITYKKYIHAQDQAGVEHPVSIYAMMAKVFGHITKEIVDQYGKQGEEVIMRGVGTFGEQRGQHIAKRAASAGKPNTIEHYLSYYDMGRSDLFEFESIHREGEIEQTFTKCPFGDQWKADGMGEYGILYCHMIDPSLARGYNPNFKVKHDQYVIREGCCHFLFYMDEE